ncbi:hypothetical protein C8R43DRAFT_960148 [Mycena crocata]|nr:hypothetical protein C8R43DRAFT_960148 [Mycena crocata]
MQNLGDVEVDQESTETEMSESGSEFDNLPQMENESETQQPIPPAEDIDMDIDEDDDSTTPTPETYLSLIDDPEEDEELLDYDITDIFKFSPLQLGTIRACIRDIDLPTWVNRPPKNLGDAQHGKLKANEYLILFTVILPVILPELWWGEDLLQRKLLKNFHHLVASLHHFQHLKQRQIDSQTTMLAIDQLKFWGPLAGLSEFPGERLNGMFGKVKHNRRVDDMPLTMLTQIARRGRLEAHLTDQQMNDGHPGQLAQILKPQVAAQTRASQRLTEVEVAKILATAKDLLEDDYQMLLQYQVSKGQPWRSCYQLPHPPGALILPPCVVQCTEFAMGSRVFSCYRSTRGNSGIQFKHPSDSSLITGYIEQIWEVPLEKHMQTFVLVQKHTSLSSTFTSKTPYSAFPLFEAKVVSAAPSNRFCIIEPKHILTHLTVYKRPKGTYGINSAVLTICWALNRGRRLGLCPVRLCDGLTGRRDGTGPVRPAENQEFLTAGYGTGHPATSTRTRPSTGLTGQPEFLGIIAMKLIYNFYAYQSAKTVFAIVILAFITLSGISALLAYIIFGCSRQFKNPDCSLKHTYLTA